MIVAYSNPTPAWVHARTISGAEVKSLEVNDMIVESVRDDLQEFEDSEDTPPVASVYEFEKKGKT